MSQITIEYDWSKVSRCTRFRIEWLTRLYRLPALMWRLAVAPFIYLVVVPVIALFVAVVTWVREWWTHQPFTSL